MVLLRHCRASASHSQSVVVQQTRKRQGESYGDVDWRQIGSWDARVSEPITQGHHEDNQEVAASVLEGENAHLVFLWHLSINAKEVLSRQVRKPVTIDSISRNGATHRRNDSPTWRTEQPGNCDRNKRESDQRPNDSSNQNQRLATRNRCFHL
jgi:hypothetical protein